MSNLAETMGEKLPAELAEMLRAAGALAERNGGRLYLVGGAVRDLLLRRPVLDLDLVMEGDAVALAGALATEYGAGLVAHHRFGTASLKRDNRRLDLATARSETYERPGALPRVRPGSISEDLSRRDFSINAIAAALSPTSYGDILDPHRGMADLERRLVRALHERSFIDDATRIWRALRYEQRLGFTIEPVTLGWLRRDIAMLATISGDRIRHELLLVLEEEYPEKALCRADELGALSRVHPALKADSQLAERFARARQSLAPELPSAGLYLALLAYDLEEAEVEQLIAYLRLDKRNTRLLRDTAALRPRLAGLAAPGLKPSAVYAVLHGYSLAALTAHLAAASPPVRERIRSYLSRLRHVKTALNGEDIKKLGIPEGPRIREILGKLRDARLDGEVKNRSDEEALVREWMRG